jgi:hypothetical protein
LGLTGLKSVVDEMGGLNSIVKLSIRNLASNKLFIMREELGKTIFIGIFLISVHSFLDCIYTRLP